MNVIDLVNVCDLSAQPFAFSGGAVQGAAALLLLLHPSPPHQRAAM